MRTLNDLSTRLESYLAEIVQAPVQVLRPRRLAGGASRASLSIELEVASGPEKGLHALVVRMDLGGVIHENALSRAEEFRVLEVAHRAGIKVPRPRWLCPDPAVLGTPFFVMDRIEGESIGRRIVREPSLARARQLLPRQLGEQLARIHALDFTQPGLEFLFSPVALAPVRGLLSLAYRQLEKVGEPHPVLELARRWLWDNAPSCPRRVLCHGDFRVGNLIVGEEGLRAILDWEFVHLGDPVEDLAWPTVRSWRFGQDQQQLGGIGSPELFLAAYEETAGVTVDRHRLAYWEILGNFRWAVGCIAQAQRHLSGQEPSVELASLGRRTAEIEQELLDLIEVAERRRGSHA